MIDAKILASLNADGMENRLANLREAIKTADFPAQDDRYINNHIHTCYSFSPYSPTAAVYAARAEGLVTAGIMDHDSIAGAEEFIRAGEIMNFPITVGMECRVRMVGTALPIAAPTTPIRSVSATWQSMVSPTKISQSCRHILHLAASCATTAIER